MSAYPYQLYTIVPIPNVNTLMYGQHTGNTIVYAQSIDDVMITPLQEPYSMGGWVLAAPYPYACPVTAQNIASPVSPVCTDVTNETTGNVDNSMTSPTTFESISQEIVEVNVLCSNNPLTATRIRRLRRRRQAKHNNACHSSGNMCSTFHRNTSNKEYTRTRLRPASRRKIHSVSVDETGDGYYAQLIRDLKTDGEVCAAAVKELSGKIPVLSCLPDACRVVQKALEVVNSKTANMLAQELRGHVWQLVVSPHGNYVLQKVIEVVPCILIKFIAEELIGIGVNVARHRYGCRILCRLIEHAITEHTTVTLLEELLAEVASLSANQFASHVLQSILEHGTGVMRQQIAEVLHINLSRLATNRYASRLIESALMYCAFSDQEKLVMKLLSLPDELPTLVNSTFGFFVVRAFAQHSQDCHDEMLKILHAKAEQLNTYGHRRVKKIETNQFSPRQR